MQFPYILVWKLHTQACEIVGGTKRKLCKRFQVDICKTKKRYICACTVAHLAVEIQDIIYNVARVRRLSTKFQVDTCKTKKDTSAHARLRTLQLRSKT